MFSCIVRELLGGTVPRECLPHHVRTKSTGGGAMRQISIASLRCDESKLAADDFKELAWPVGGVRFEVQTGL